MHLIWRTKLYGEDGLIHKTQKWLVVCSDSRQVSLNEVIEVDLK